MPSYLAEVNPHVAYDMLRVELTKEENINKFEFSQGVYILEKRIQQARHEQLVLKLSSAYKEYILDFPA